MPATTPTARRRALLDLHLLGSGFPALHGLRSLAVVLVLQVHLTVTLSYARVMRSPPGLARSTSLYFAMDLFFVLSGFLIGTLLLPDADGRPRRDLLRFYARRAFRIVPLYYVVLTALAVFGPTVAAQRGRLVLEYAYLTNYPLFAKPPVMPWAWSLCIEEHFYLAVPLLALALARLPHPRWRISALALLWLAGLGARYAVYAAHAGPWDADDLFRALYLPTHARVDILVAGVLVAHVHRYHGERVRRALRPPAARLGLGALAALCAGALLGPLAARSDAGAVFAWGTVTSVLYAALLLLLLDADKAASRVLSSRWFHRFGTLGYGVYLVHPPLIEHAIVPLSRALLARWHLPLPVIWTASLAALLALATATAYALHLAVEKPALWLRDRLAP